jgi:hypothetical protein
MQLELVAKPQKEPYGCDIILLFFARCTTKFTTIDGYCDEENFGYIH